MPIRNLKRYFRLEDDITLKLTILYNFHSTSTKRPLTIVLPWQQVKSQVNKMTFSDAPCLDPTSLKVSFSYCKPSRCSIKNIPLHKHKQVVLFISNFSKRCAVVLGFVDVFSYFTSLFAVNIFYSWVLNLCFSYSIHRVVTSFIIID